MIRGASPAPDTPSPTAASGFQSPPARAEAGRVHAIDGLRGIAAILVVLFHLHGAIERTAHGWLWFPIDWVVRNGFLGVDVFFVISGFVIALSVSRGAPTLGYFGRFVLRRSIRLDPPYWIAILLEVSLIYATMRLFAGIPATLPSVPQVLAHLVYAQELLGYGSIVNIFWTLCYEVQFYAFYVLLGVAYAAVPARWRGTALPVAVAIGLYLFSLLTRYWRPEWIPHGLAIDRWFQFFIGVLTWRTVGQSTPWGWLVGAWTALVVAVLVAGAPVTQLLAVGISALILCATRYDRVARALSVRPLKFLGAISYSLYLYHSSVGWRFVSLLQRWFPGEWSPVFAWGVYLVGVAGCVAFSALLWWLVERPCLSLCHRIRLPLRAAPAPG